MEDNNTFNLNRNSICHINENKTRNVKLKQRSPPRLNDLKDIN